ncbi:putative relaxosome component [Photorhabdus temperata subsp. temperata M1021]|nr:putative relaxosome component [Photorhabdus temperata subsp. temperata M1021]
MAGTSSSVLVGTLMAAKQKKEIVVSLRITPDEFSPFEKQIKESQLSRSAFFRKLVLDKKDFINIEVKDTRQLLYLFNKSSNNINQLALKVNVAHKNGTISDKKYILFLNALLNIEALMKKAVEDAD